MTEKDFQDAKELIEIYKNTPVDKRPILTATLNAFLAGAEVQERSALTRDETARLERCLLEQASNSLSLMTIHYCDYVEAYMNAAPPDEKRLEAVQQGIRTLNHISVTLERLRRALQETAPAETKG